MTTKSKIVWAALEDLRNQEQIATRQRLAEITGFNISTVDECVNRWVDAGKLRRPAPGVVEIIDPIPEPRAVSLMILPGGLSKVEVGEFCVDLWPQERRALASLLVGDAMQLNGIQMGHEFGVLTTALYTKLRSAEQRLGVIEAREKQTQASLDLDDVA